MEHIEYNIHNLLNLYATVGKPVNGYASDSAIGYSRIQASEWPNKIWSNQKLTPDVLQNIKILIESSQINLRFIDFEFDGRANHTLIEQDNYNKAVIVSGDGDYYNLVKYLDSKNKLEKVLSPSLKNSSILIRKAAKDKFSVISDLRNKVEYKKRTS